MPLRLSQLFAAAGHCSHVVCKLRYRTYLNACVGFQQIVPTPRYTTSCAVAGSGHLWEFPCSQFVSEFHLKTPQPNSGQSALQMQQFMASSCQVVPFPVKCTFPEYRTCASTHSAWGGARLQHHLPTSSRLRQHPFHVKQASPRRQYILSALRLVPSFCLPVRLHCTHGLLPPGGLRATACHGHDPPCSQLSKLHHLPRTLSAAFRVPSLGPSPAPQ
jgi:hypothetical protein